MEFTLPGTRALCNTLAPGRLKRRLSVAPGAWETGRSTISNLVSARGASCTSSDGAASSETGGRRGTSVTAYKREGIPALKGRHNQRLATSSKRKADMAARRLQRGTGNITQGIHAAGRWTRPSSGAVISLRASSTSSHGHRRAKLACQLTLLLYHTWSPSMTGPQSHRTGLLTRLRSSILPAPLAGSIAEREAGSACSRRERSVAALCYVVECNR